MYLPVGQNEPILPTYQSAAAALEKKNGAGLRLVGWTLARATLIAGGMLIVGVRLDKAVAGAVVASALVTTLAVCALAQERV